MLLHARLPLQVKGAVGRCGRRRNARDIARALAKSEAFERSRRHRKSVEMLFAHLKRILRLGAASVARAMRCADEFTLAAIAQNIHRLARLVARPPPAADACLAYPMPGVSAL
jgi:hypothetical protein